MTNMDCHIRWLIRRDRPEVLNIDHESFEFPWGESELIRALRRRNCIGLVAEWEERIVGYFLYSLYVNRIVIGRLAVAEDCRRRGVGTDKHRACESGRSDIPVVGPDLRRHPGVVELRRGHRRAAGNCL